MKAAVQNWFARMSSVCAIAFCCSTLVAQENADGPILTIGSQAPQLDIEHWISDGNGRFKPVTKFEPGHVYVIEFWATSCGPCIAGMPHTAQLQEKYADQNVQIIGVSHESVSDIEKSLKERLASDEKYPTYDQLTKAYCLTTDPDRSVYEDYMTAAGYVGIPEAFLVGKSGLIEWIGLPMDIDDPLQQVVDDQWDRGGFLAKIKTEQQLRYLESRFINLAQEGKIAEPVALIAASKIAAEGDAGKLGLLEHLEYWAVLGGAVRKMQKGSSIDDVFAELDAIAKKSSPSQQTKIGMVKVRVLLSVVIEEPARAEAAAASMRKLAETEGADPKFLHELPLTVYRIFQEPQMRQNGEVAKPLIAASITVAEVALKSSPDNATFIDTLAHLVYIQGDVDRAIQLESQAVEKADPDNKESMETFLEELKTAKHNSKD